MVNHFVRIESLCTLTLNCVAEGTVFRTITRVSIINSNCILHVDKKFVISCFNLFTFCHVIKILEKITEWYLSVRHMTSKLTELRKGQLRGPKSSTSLIKFLSCRIVYSQPVK